MPTIRVLPDILASQVAAGEVVERPASVVKELVENSIDAGAREVRVDMDQGGVGLIRVSDDGCGMTREDALLSLERHATSKLRSSGDLAAIRTLGFRGEAVPSIASVSRFRMVTREAAAVVGTEILVEGGKVRDVRDAGCAPGTVIEARALFFNMPARRKFLRAESTESAHVEHQLRLHALAAPGVRFRLRRDEREIFDLAPAAKAVDRVRQLLGNELSRELVALPRTRGQGIVVEGFVLPASHARKGRRHQFVFLNGRPVEDGVIARALVEGFRGALVEGMYPAAWLWLELEPNLVDVNVHPAKREVRFHRPVDVREAIVEAVTQALRPARLEVEPSWKVEGQRVVETVPSDVQARIDSQMLSKAQQPLLPILPQSEIEIKSVVEVEAVAVPVAAGRIDFRVIGLLHHRYVLLEGEDGLVLLDPRAAKERILYERLLAQHETGLEVQGLLVPVLLELDPRDLDLILRERMAIQEAGIELAAFGGNTLQILTLPACLVIDDPRSFLGALVDELLHGAVPGSRFAFERLVRVLVRRVSALVVPKLAEVNPLLRELFECELPYCAADGRPTLSEFSLKEIDRRFGNS